MPSAARFALVKLSTTAEKSAENLRYVPFFEHFFSLLNLTPLPVSTWFLDGVSGTGMDLRKLQSSSPSPGKDWVMKSSLRNIYCS